MIIPPGNSFTSFGDHNFSSLENSTPPSNSVVVKKEGQLRRIFTRGKQLFRRKRTNRVSPEQDIHRTAHQVMSQPSTEGSSSSAQSSTLNHHQVVPQPSDETESSTSQTTVSMHHYTHPPTIVVQPPSPRSEPVSPTSEKERIWTNLKLKQDEITRKIADLHKFESDIGMLERQKMLQGINIQSVDLTAIEKEIAKIKEIRDQVQNEYSKLLSDYTKMYEFFMKMKKAI